MAPTLARTSAVSMAVAGARRRRSPRTGRCSGTVGMAWGSGRGAGHLPRGLVLAAWPPVDARPILRDGDGAARTARPPAPKEKPVWIHLRRATLTALGPCPC